MEPRRPKHKQQPPLVVTQEELETALKRPETYITARTLAAAGECSDPDARNVDDELFPPGAACPPSVSVVHTHMSMVFLLPGRVYKLKKEVDFGFADFSTLYKRFQACFAEVQLNRRLAPDVYVGVVPVSMQRTTRAIAVRCDDFWTPAKGASLDYWLNDAFGEIVEWAVHMVRLPDDHTLLHLLREARLSRTHVAQVAQLLVDFHATARRSAAIDAFGRETVIRANIDQNFAQTAAHAGATVSEPVYRRVQELTYARLRELRPAIAARAANGYTCDSHGDLRLEHVYVDPRQDADRNDDNDDKNDDDDGTGSRRFVVLDCIEFNEQFRYGDPLSDVAFLVMDLWHEGRPDLARELQQQYLRRAAQDTPENAALVAFYAAYRAVVRAKVGGFRVFDATLSPAQRDVETARARSYWLVALSFLAPPAERPCLLLIAGLPASGKSSLAQMLAADARHVTWLRADAIRKELVGRPTATTDGNENENENDDDDTSADTHDNVPAGATSGSFEEGIYSPAVTARTYDEILRRSVALLRRGERAVVDATFRDRALRERFVAAARAEGALLAFIVCECDREIVRGRLLARKDDASDATWEVFERMEQTWDVADSARAAEGFVVNTEKEKELTLRRVQGFLRSIGLL
ncbi:hypothetical protein PybrP1_000166 [[Pythium] brassicae (nom. inval.)]|nr:hypothetical protein PybrP1_000166 [[Pythium] brassicae (nom. inval.)]